MAQSYGPYHKKNCSWPLTDSGRGWHRAALVERLEHALKHLLRTPRGSIVHDLDYGTDYYKMRAQGHRLDYDNDTAVGFHHQAQNQIAKYIPDITVSEITLVPDTNDMEHVTISVTWLVPAPQGNRVKEFGTPKTTTVSI